MKKIRKIALFLAITMLIGLIHPIHVVQAATQKASLSKSKISIEVGSSKTLKLNNTKDVKSVKWTSSNKSIVQVSKKGKITAKKAGKATITCKVTYKNKKKASLKCSVQVSPKASNSRGVLGTWYLQYVTLDNSDRKALAKLVIKNDGTLDSIYYPLFNTTTESYFFETGPLDIRSEQIGKVRWRLDGNDFFMIYLDGEVKYTFSEKDQTLISDDIVFSRKELLPPEGYMRLYDLTDNTKEFVSKISGTWYFDLTTWTFNTDGTGGIDFPASGKNEAKYREFEYKLYVADDNFSLVDITFWDDNREFSSLTLIINEDGSLTFENTPIVLKRTFDLTNCPLTEKKVKDIYKFLTGDIFSDWLED